MNILFIIMLKKLSFFFTDHVQTMLTIEPTVSSNFCECNAIAFKTQMFDVLDPNIATYH